LAAIPKLPLHFSNAIFLGYYREKSMACVQVDFIFHSIFITRVSEKMQFLYYT
jgi:hypothetical protein